MDAVSDFLQYIGYDYPEDRKRDENPLWLLGVPPFCAETRIYIQHQFVLLVRESDWTEKDKAVWIQTYILGETAEEIAADIGCTSQEVNERFQACAEKLPDMVRKWWAERLADNPEERLPELLHEYIVDMCNNLEDDDDENEDEF